MPSDPPSVELGERREGGLAPAIMVIVDRGARLRPELCRELEAQVELALEGHPPVLIRFRGAEGAVVEDASEPAADLRVSGSLADLGALLAAPLVGGMPNPIDRRGRAALGMLAGGRVRVEGRLALMRRFLGLIRI